MVVCGGDDWATLEPVYKIPVYLTKNLWVFLGSIVNNWVLQANIHHTSIFVTL